ncbi:hypothetical protein C8J57DRAFT_1009537, partial [Mycena rebaudengoi]
PHAPSSKSDKLGRFADWQDSLADNRPSAAAQGGQNACDGGQAFGSGIASAFAYFHMEHKSSSS